MPGTRSGATPRTWFHDAFGFEEVTVQDSLKKLKYDRGILTSDANGRPWRVGTFAVNTLEVLKQRLQRLEDHASADYGYLGECSFENVLGDARQLHLSEENASAVFQVASLFNCLESVPEGAGPESGIGNYWEVSTQGCAAACACPAGTAYRSYFFNGKGQMDPRNQVDLMSAVSAEVNNEQHKYYVMRNGYCLPRFDGSLATLSDILSKDCELANRVRDKVAVGLMRDTEVATGTHLVHQVFCSCLPVAKVKRVRASQWEKFTRIVLEAGYEATLALAAMIAAQECRRVTVFLTCVGGGALGARREWISAAIQGALEKFNHRPLDVKLVHFAEVLPPFDSLHVDGTRSEKLRRRSRRRSTEAEAKHQAACLTQQLSQSDLEEGTGRDMVKVIRMFESFDLNGDGSISKDEFELILQKVDPEFFTPHVVEVLLMDADADGDGEIHYLEFAKWLFNESDEIFETLAAIDLEAP